MGGWTCSWHAMGCEGDALFERSAAVPRAQRAPCSTCSVLNVLLLSPSPPLSSLALAALDRQVASPTHPKGIAPGIQAEREDASLATLGPVFPLRSVAGRAIPLWLERAAGRRRALESCYGWHVGACSIVPRGTEHVSGPCILSSLRPLPPPCQHREHNHTAVRASVLWCDLEWPCLALRETRVQVMCMYMYM